jgi:hypothetical protein
MIQKLKSFGAGAAGLAVIIVLLFCVVLFLHGVEWISDKVFPFFLRASIYVIFASIFVLLPLSLIRSTRSFAASLIILGSYLVGLTAWMFGLLTTMDLWGGGAVIFGLLLAGIGVVPLGILAALFHGLWATVFSIAGLTVMTFASRGYAAWILEKDKAAEENANFFYEPDLLDQQAVASLAPPLIDLDAVAVADADPRYRYCSECRVRVGKNDAYCKRCGAHLA